MERPLKAIRRMLMLGWSCLEGAKDVPTPSFPARKEKLMTGRPQCTDSVLEVCSTTRKTEHDILDLVGNDRDFHHNSF